MGDVISEAALAEQLKFFRDVLDGAPPSRTVRLEVREDRDTVTAVREESEWPLARTRWRPLYLGGHLASAGVLAAEQPQTAGSITYETLSQAATFSWTVPADIELTGPMVARLWVGPDGCDDTNLSSEWKSGATERSSDSKGPTATNATG